MRAADFLREVCHALLRDRLRTALTVAGIAVGTFAVATLVSLGATIRDSIANSMSGLGENLVIVTPIRGKGGAFAGALATAAELHESDAALLRRLSTVRAVASVVMLRSTAALGADSATTNCFGVDTHYFTVLGVELDDGETWGEESDATAGPIAVVGATVARRLFPEGGEVGRFVEVDGHRVRIVGVAREQGRGADGTDQDDYVLVPKSFARGQLVARGSPAAVDAVFVLAVPGQVDDAVDDVADALRGARANVDLRDAISVNSLRGLMAASVQAADLLTTLMGAMASISVLVGGVGIVNVMLANIADRRVEIGLKLALGAPPIAIASEFLVAAVVLALSGALVGLAGAQGLASLMTVAKVMPVALTVQAVGLSVALGLGVGVAAGVYPAARAARLQPREILRDA